MYTDLEKIKKKSEEKIYNILEQNNILVENQINSKNYIKIFIDQYYGINLYHSKKIFMNYPEIYLLIDLDNYNKYITFKDKKKEFFHLIK